MERSQLWAVVCLTMLGTASAIAQKAQVTTHVHERMICVVPLTGSGTWADPKRPLLAPTISSNGILGYSFVASDDGKYAIVEIVASSSAALTAIQADPRVVSSFASKILYEVAAGGVEFLLFRVPRGG